MDIKAYLQDKRKLIDDFIAGYFNASLKPDALRHSMAYSLTAGGKRIRPILCIASYEACGGMGDDIVPYASAIEFIHTYSLIHDDLPAMDNDDLRRGKPTNHKVFGEGMAILAGDGLFSEAFYILSYPHAVKLPLSEDKAELTHQGAFPFPHTAILRVIHDIAAAAGNYGMVAGQAQDILSEDAYPESETLLFIHTHKTAALITAAVRAGGILACCSGNALSMLTSYGQNIGLAFQIIDDILDVQGETEIIGKTKGSDEKKKKMTYPRLYGIEESKRKARDLIDKAIESLKLFDKHADPLREIAKYLIERQN